MEDKLGREPRPTTTTQNNWWICDICGFNAKELEPLEEKQPGAMKWHKALHENDRINNGN